MPNPTPERPAQPSEVHTETVMTGPLTDEEHARWRELTFVDDRGALTEAEREERNALHERLYQTNEARRLSRLCPACSEPMQGMEWMRDDYLTDEADRDWHQACALKKLAEIP